MDNKWRIDIMVYLEEATLEKYDIYHKIRCSKSDIYWNGYNSGPDYVKFMEVYKKRVCGTAFSESGDGKIFFVKIKNAGKQDEYIGFVQMLLKDDELEMGYGIIDEFHGKGYGTRALGEGIKIAVKYRTKIIVKIRDDNIASKRMSEKNGFVATDEYQLVDYPKAGIVKFRTYRLNGTGERKI